MYRRASAVVGVAADVLIVLGGIAAAQAFGSWLASTLTDDPYRGRRAMQAMMQLGIIRRYIRATGTIAGKAYSPFALLCHVGRRSGQTHQTVVGAAGYGDGFILPLVWGRQSDWCQNVLSAGKATLAWRGRTYELENPEIIPATSKEALSWPAWDRLKLSAVREYLWLHQKQQQPQPHGFETDICFSLRQPKSRSLLVMSLIQCAMN